MTTSVPRLSLGSTGRNILKETDKFKKIFDSEDDTFKIVIHRVATITLAASTANQNFFFPHGLNFIPMVTAFAKETAISQIFSPNADNVNLWGSKVGWTSTGVRFNSITVDRERVICNFDNSVASTVTVDISYYCLESI